MKLKTICIIDDDPIYQLLIKKVIAVSNTGYSSMYFKNGKEALDFFIADPNNLPEIILLDIEMPVMNGWGFLKEIDAINTDRTAIYVVSSSISHEDRETAKSFTRIKGYFSKPFDVEKVLDITGYPK